MKRLVDSEVAGVALSVDPRTIRRWVKTGKLENYGTGSRIRIDLQELIALADGRVASPGLST